MRKTKFKPNELDRKIGFQIQNLRKNRGFRRVDFAADIDVSNASLQRYEEGRCRITVSLIVMICNKLGIDISDFFSSVDCLKQNYRNKI